MMGANGALVTWDAGGNEFIEVIRTIQACEQAGIKTVFLTSEDDPTGNVPTMLEPIAEVDAIVSREKISGRLRDGLVPTAGPLEAPQRYDDHYGFNKLSSVEY